VPLDPLLGWMLASPQIRRAITLHAEPAIAIAVARASRGRAAMAVQIGQDGGATGVFRTHIALTARGQLATMCVCPRRTHVAAHVRPARVPLVARSWLATVPIRVLRTHAAASTFETGIALIARNQLTTIRARLHRSRIAAVPFPARETIRAWNGFTTTICPAAHSSGATVRRLCARRWRVLAGIAIASWTVPGIRHTSAARARHAVLVGAALHRA
jgi:hypothetical protein